MIADHSLALKGFEIAPCEDCDIPGYMILMPVRRVRILSDLDPLILHVLGPAIAKLEKAIQAETGADRVYVVRFSEALEDVHFHLFPRTASLAPAYLAAARPRKENINGPRLFAWAREAYSVAPGSLSAETIEAAAAIKMVMLGPE